MLGQTRIAWLKSGPSPICASRPRLSQLIYIFLMLAPSVPGYSFFFYISIISFFTQWYFFTMVELVLLAFLSSFPTWSPLEPLDLLLQEMYIIQLVGSICLSPFFFCPVQLLIDVTHYFTICNAKEAEKIAERGIQTVDLPCAEPIRYYQTTAHPGPVIITNTIEVNGMLENTFSNAKGRRFLWVLFLSSNN